MVRDESAGAEQDEKETNESRQILESIVNPKIQLDPWLDQLIETIGLSEAGRGRGETVGRGISVVRNLARIPDLVRHPDLHHSEVMWRYPRLRADCQTVRIRLAKITELISSSKADPPSMKVYAHCQTAYGLALIMATILNSILRAFDPCGTSLAEDSASFVHEILTLAERASPFRPLTAGYIPLCLTIGWAATDDLSRKVDIERYLAEYQSDLADVRWLEGAIWLKAQYGSWRRKSSTPFPGNALDRCGVDADAIICEPKKTNSSCDVQ